MSADIASIAINVTICGLAIVFGTLIVLVIIFWAFGKIMNGVSGKGKSDKKSVKKAAPDAKPAAAPVSSPAPAAVQDDDELIAVISAAVAVMSDIDGKKYVVRNVRPASAGRSAWAAAGIAQNTKAF